METATKNQPMTREEIDALPINRDGSIDLGIYVSIPYFNHRVFKCRGCGLMLMHERSGLDLFIADFKEKGGPGTEVRFYPSTIGDRIHADGSIFLG